MKRKKQRRLTKGWRPIEEFDLDTAVEVKLRDQDGDETSGRWGTHDLLGAGLYRCFLIDDEILVALSEFTHFKVLGPSTPITERRPLLERQMYEPRMVMN